MYSIPWIIENMIWQPKETPTSRRPGEAELRVQKSLQQLTIPDWYANKCVASPKIIVDRRPFESRPAPWKDPSRIRALIKNNMEKIDVVKPELDYNEATFKLGKFSEVVKTSDGNSPSYASKTFPKMSPSRKIQNINIVFPTTTSSPKTPVQSINDEVASDTDSMDSSVVSTDSLEKFTPQKIGNLENEPMSVMTSIPIEDSTVQTSLVQEIPKTPKMNYRSPTPPTTPPRSSYWEDLDLVDLRFLTQKTLPDVDEIFIRPVSKLVDTGFLWIPEETEKTPRMNYLAPSSPSTPVKMWNENRSDISDESLDEESLFSTSKKSTEMENIIKKQQKRLSGKSFVEEIIQELNAKCRSKVKSNYVSPVSKNFVKKLVRELEMGFALKPKFEDETDESCSDEYISSSSSATDSMKDCDSENGSESELNSPKLNVSTGSGFLRFSMALQNHGKTPRDAILPYIDDENDSVYWIPLPNCKLPRTSSLKNMMSKLSSYLDDNSPSPTSSNTSSDSSEEPPPSLQPTNPQSSSSSGWGKTFDKRQTRFRQLFRINETTVIDSGYSDRSRAYSLSSSEIDDSWYDDSETTQTASEISEVSENLQSTDVKIHGMPVNNMERTFIV